MVYTKIFLPFLWDIKPKWLKLDDNSTLTLIIIASESSFNLQTTVVTVEKLGAVNGVWGEDPGLPVGSNVTASTLDGTHPWKGTNQIVETFSSGT